LPAANNSNSAQQQLGINNSATTRQQLGNNNNNSTTNNNSTQTTPRQQQLGKLLFFELSLCRTTVVCRTTRQRDNSPRTLFAKECVETLWKRHRVVSRLLFS